MVTNQFGSATLVLAQPNLLCLPSWKSLTGPPGIGKTRLSFQVAHDLLDQFRDGAFRVALSPVTDRPGWPNQDELIDRYAGQSGRSLETLPYFEVFAFFKIAAVVQQIYYRYVHGHATDERFASFGDRVTYLGRSAARRIERA